MKKHSSKYQRFSYRYRPTVKASLRPRILTSKDAENILRQVWNDDIIELQEEFKVMLLNRYNKVIEFS